MSNIPFIFNHEYKKDPKTFYKRMKFSFGENGYDFKHQPNKIDYLLNDIPMYMENRNGSYYGLTFQFGGEFASKELLAFLDKKFWDRNNITFVSVEECVKFFNEHLTLFTKKLKHIHSFGTFDLD